MSVEVLVHRPIDYKGGTLAAGIHDLDINDLPLLASPIASQDVTFFNPAKDIYQLNIELNKQISNLYQTFVPHKVFTSSDDLLNNHIHIADAAFILCELLLPETAAVGTFIKVVGKGNATWQINQNADQFIRSSIGETTAGILGSLASSLSGDCVGLICITEDTEWMITDLVGTLVFV
jgi:hypothetical protein